MIIDGRAIAAEILAECRARVEILGRRPKLLAYVGNETPATRSYLVIKKKAAQAADCEFQETTSPDFTIETDAIIVQLPLPKSVDTQALLNSIPLEKDADVLSSAARSVFEGGGLRNPRLLPPVVTAVKKILEIGKVAIAGKRATVIGEGFLVGAPVAVWLRQQGADVTVVTLESDNLELALCDADIIVSGAGSPHLIKPEMLKDGVVLIDAGTSELGGKLAGDADPVCAGKCSLFTPVPGGVGPIAVACLFENVVTLAER